MSPTPTEQLLPLPSPGVPCRPSAPPPARPASLCEKVKSRVSSGDKFFSLEFFPPRTRPGAVNLLSRLERLRAGDPLFVDITWHPAGNPGGDSDTSSMMIAQVAVNYLGLETMLHMTCVGASKEDISGHLQKAKRLGLRNILALRGDLPDVSQDWVYDPDKFNFGTDLVRHIRRTTGDQFSVCVSGYPGGHPEAASYHEDLLHLKEKVEAGADFIITQLFFSVNTFKKFVDDCRSLGIKCPIIPGILPIQTHDSLRHIVKLSKLEVPDEISSIVNPLKGNDEAIQKFGIHQASEMIRDLFNSGYAPGVHFYTLNKEVASVAILKSVGLWGTVGRSLPWRQSAHPCRRGEGVRPVFWRHRHRAYIHSTRHCSSFPATSWDSSLLPALSCHRDEDTFFLASQSTPSDLLKMWGTHPAREEDVRAVFSSYYGGEGVTRLPWLDTENDEESEEVRGRLVQLSREGLLTINYLPSANGLDSQDCRQGWGEAQGYVFQKAYIELFTSEENVAAISEVVQRYPGVTFQAVNKTGAKELTNISHWGPSALTWAVFHDREVLQPTVVDPDAFRVWAREAFGLWGSRWGALYQEESEPRQFINHFADKLFLVYLVDNEFTRGNRLWELLKESSYGIKSVR